MDIGSEDWGSDQAFREQFELPRKEHNKAGYEYSEIDSKQRREYPSDTPVIKVDEAEISFIYAVFYNPCNEITGDNEEYIDSDEASGKSWNAGMK